MGKRKESISFRIRHAFIESNPDYDLIGFFCLFVFFTGTSFEFTEALISPY